METQRNVHAAQFSRTQLLGKSVGAKKIKFYSWNGRGTEIVDVYMGGFLLTVQRLILMLLIFLATLVAQHLTPVSKSVVVSD